MRILKKIFLFFLAALGLLLIAALFVDGTIKVQESIDINVPAEKVWTFTSSLTMLNAWNAWLEKDKTMRTSISGREGYPGSRFCWDSEQADPGKGCVQLSRLIAQRSIELNLLFLEPYQAAGKAYISLRPQGAGTRVTLDFNSRVPYPFHIMTLFEGRKNRIATNCTQSLRLLKELCETP